ncbi:MAG: hypothetical protein HFJ12_00840 [Bacilli bacterium]|nr:hypothetical protein [Bacilli bacterium]
MRKYMKDHKIIVVAVIFLLLLIGLAFVVKGTFFANSGNIFYGDRLKGIKEVMITSSQQKGIISTLKDDSAVKSAKYSLQGKIVNIIITVNDDVGIDTAKSLSPKILDNLDDDQKKFYDIQVFIKKNNEASDFPIIGYKQNKKDNFVWTKDRAAS